MNNEKKIIFLMASISQPRCIKRIQSFIEFGYAVEIYGFNRGVYSENAYVKGAKINDLGFAPSGVGYVKKFFNASSVLKSIFKKFNDEDVIYYAFSFDLAVLCKMYSRKRYIYEISDIVYTYFKKSSLQLIFKRIDKWIIKNSFLTIMTSEGFNNYLFPTGNINNNIIIQSNKVNSKLITADRGSEVQTENTIIFSYIGAFRYPNTVFRLARIIGEKYPQHEFYFWGDSNLTDLAIELSKKYENIKYFGAFKNPEDLVKIYKTIDVVVACYDIETLNERIAEPNKLYEAMFFIKPIIVSKETFLAQKVADFKCGFAIDATNDLELCQFIDNLSLEKLNEIKFNIKKIKLSEMIDDDAKQIIDYVTNTK